MDPADLQQNMQKLFPGHLGIEFVETGPERVVARLAVRTELCTLPGVLHGGAVMAFADTLGAVGAFLNLRDGASTTTIESKTNFFAPGVSGTTVTGECTPLHRGRRTMVWQTRVSDPEGRLIALVTQTQAVLEARRGPAETLAAFFEGQPLAEQQQLLETLEHAGAALYRQWAGATDDPAVRGELLASAEREDQNAAALARLRR